MKKTFSDYDLFAEEYIAHTENPLSWNNLYERPAMLSLFASFSNKKVLDVGCGSGFYSFYALSEQATVTAVDISQKLLDLVKQKDSKHQITTLQADLNEGLSAIPSNSMDIIIASLVLHYIKDPHLLINDFSRVLKKDGKVYISTHHPFLDYLHLQKVRYFDIYEVEENWGSPEKPMVVRYYTRPLSSLLEPLMNSGLSITGLYEPLPSEEVKKKAPKVYEKLSQKPGFLFLILEKK